MISLTPWDGVDATLPGRALTWTRSSDGDVAIACGRGHLAFLHPEHTVHPDGRITPSLGCPDEECDWHEFGQLEGWTEG